MQLFDTHCHLQDDRLKERVDSIITRARAAGVTCMLCCGTQESDWDAVARLSETYPEIIPAFGLHPWFIKHRSSQWIDRLESLLTMFPRAALGEIGIDHALKDRNDEEQAEVFVAQLKLARRLERPVSIHCRKAWGSLMAILTQQCGLPDGGAIHSYSGPPDLIETLASLNVSFSFSGSITHDRNRRGCSAAEAVPDDRLLVETDSPDIPPQGIGEGQNEPAYLPRVVQKLAELRGVTVDRIAQLTAANGKQVFKSG